MAAMTKITRATDFLCKAGAAVATSLGLALAAQSGALAQEAMGSAAAMQAKLAQLQPRLHAKVFGEPLTLDSHESEGHVEGDVYAEVNLPFALVASTFESAADVCDVLLLHLNVHACRPQPADKGGRLMLTVGAKQARTSAAHYRMTYAMRVEDAGPAYLRTTFIAAQGPVSTRDHRIIFEAVPIDANRSFVHFNYGYSYGLMAKMAMQAYLATAGRAKIGFTVVDHDAEGHPVYVRGERASLERNVMRYYLALLAYGSVHEGAPKERMEARLRAWFKLTERYAPQLHEFDLDEYLHEKHQDLDQPQPMKEQTAQQRAADGPA